jgi:hypothetical protein
VASFHAAFSQVFRQGPTPDAICQGAAAPAGPLLYIMRIDHEMTMKGAIPPLFGGF